MASVPVWLLGRHLTACSLTPQTVASDGVLTPGTTKTLTAKINRVKLRGQPVLDNVSPVNATKANNVIVEDDFVLELEVLLVSNGENPLAAAVTSADYFTGTFTRGGQAWSCTVVRGEFDDGVENKGKNTSSLMLHCADIGTTNPTYV